MSTSKYARYGALFAKSFKLLKLVKLAKPLMVVGSMMLSIGAYGLAYGWAFGFGLVGLLLIHELGHVWAAHRYGVKASWPIFIPFIGAAIFVSKFETVRKESAVAIAGPLVGAAGALLLLIPFFVTGKPIWAGLTYIGIILNAFNMLPIKPLDGGRMTEICGKWFRAFGFFLLILLSLIVREPVMLYVWVLVISDIPFRVWWRTAIASFLGLAMATLMALGYSHQSKYIDGIDIAVVALMIFFYWGVDIGLTTGTADPFIETFDEVIPITLTEKCAWACAWFGTTVAFGLILWALHGYAGTVR